MNFSFFSFFRVSRYPFLNGGYTLCYSAPAADIVLFEGKFDLHVVNLTLMGNGFKMADVSY